jgi:hypothetical protein
MAYKKNILDKYIKIKEIEFPESLEEQEIERLKTIIENITSDKNSLEIKNSLLQYQNIKLTKEKKELQDKLYEKIHNKIHNKINSNIMNWEIFEEINFDNWLYKKISDSDNISKKRKSLLSIEKTIDELNDELSNTMDNHIHHKKQKLQHIHQSSIQQTTKKDKILIYDSDETETDDELLSF